MRYVRGADLPSDINLVVSQEGGQLFYTTTRSVEPKEELKVWYSEKYATDRGLKVVPELRNNEPGNQ